ncbi:MAG: YkgJ family cysteine cluster protein [Deltaproteobacteria bacterium]|nr:YkgJ family cysteine cluster protein [Deltaproteobacteria bacterium]
MKLPPPVPAAIRERLLQAFARLTSFVEGVVRLYPEEVACRPGCDACCRQELRLRGVEAAYVLEGARQLLPEAISLVWATLSAPDSEVCPLLQGGTCLVYEHRPAVCRSHGLPMVRRGGGGALLHHCPENFRSVDASLLPPSSLLDEERLCVLMDALDALYARETGWEGERISVAELLRRGLRP